MTDQKIEDEIQAKGLTAARVTLAEIVAAIQSEHYFTAEDGTAGASNGTDTFPEDHPMRRLTFCTLIMRNGFTVTGQSACVSPQNFDPEIGRKVARQNAIDQCWPLFGFALADRLYRESQPTAQPR